MSALILIVLCLVLELSLLRVHYALQLDTYAGRGMYMPCMHASAAAVQQHGTWQGVIRVRHVTKPTIEAFKLLQDQRQQLCC